MPSHRPIIGGPGSLLPQPVESFLSWSLCISCLGVSGYHYCVSTYIVPLLTRIRLLLRFDGKDGNSSIIHAHSTSYASCWIPITTHSRNELDRCTPIQRYHQLVSMLQFHGLETNSSETDGVDDAGVSEQTESRRDKLVEILRKDAICRRLASLAMRPFPKRSDGIQKCNSSSHKLGLASMSLIDHKPRLILVHDMAAIWPRLLELPVFISPSHYERAQAIGNTESTHMSKRFQISVIMPSYAETGDMLEKQILRLLNRCEDAKKVEIIIVDAGGGAAKDSLELTVEKFKTRISTNITSSNDTYQDDCSIAFGNVQLLKFQEGGGRGPCLNFGAAAARGHILTFCHLDTTLPANWDRKICSTLLDTKRSFSSNKWARRPNSCAFGFGIDTSPGGLLNGQVGKDNPYYPPGILAVESTANIRTYLYSLPYGDQAISMQKHIFEFLGGFPDQCLMEDYELVALLRKRAKLLDTKPKEALQIIDGPAAMCSPRRWQKYGVLYVTYMNSKFVNLYSGGMGPDQLYELYYERRPPHRRNELSPWEIEMRLKLKK